jgi:hypothetical protein
MPCCKDPEREIERRKKIFVSHIGKPSGMLGKNFLIIPKD